MKASQRDDLIKLIDNTAGPVPSEISNALADLDGPIARMTEGIDKTVARAAFNTILASNLKLGTSPGEEKTNPGVILSLRQKVLALSVDPETGPVVTPTSFANRAAFDAWLPSQTQAVNLDGAGVHTGFGPASNWYTQGDGSISQTPVVATPAPPVVLPPAGPAPSGVQLLADWDQAAATSRSVACAPGQTYAIRFYIPRGPYKDAQPRIQGSATVVPSASGSVAVAVMETAAELAAAGGAGGAAQEYIAMTPALEGEIRYLVFRVEHATNMLVRVLVPTPV